MALHDLNVRIGWGTAAVAADEVFILDDATYGLLDSNVLGLPYGTGHIPADLTAFVDSVSWRRGRSNEFEEPRAGSVSLNMIDTDSSFDPLNTSSSYTVTLGAPVELEYAGTQLGEFYVTELQATHQKGADVTFLAVSGTDRLAVLAADMDTIASSHGGDTTGARLDRVLDASEIAWTGQRAVDAGSSTMLATTFGESALSHAQKCARTERGRLFINAAGQLVFHGRHNNPNASPVATFSDDGSDIPYVRLVQASSSEMFWNRAKVTANDVDYTAADAASIAATGLTITKALTIETDSAADAQAVADDVVARFADSGRSVFEELTVNVRALSAAQRAIVLGLQIGDKVTVERSGPGASQVSCDHVIEGVSGSATVAAMELTFHLTEDTGSSVFVLDDPVFGVLDTGPGRLTF